MVERELNYQYAKKESYHYSILMVLQKEMTPMTAMQITKKVLKFKKTKGKTPDATIRSLLQRSSYVQQAGKGFWKLKPKIKISVVD